MSNFRTLFFLAAVLLTPAIAAADDEDYSSSEDVSQADVMVSADANYDQWSDYSYGYGSTDCTHYVQEVYNDAGIDVGYVTTGSFATSPEYYEIDAGDAEPGDVILYDGHAGIYSGEDAANGQADGYQMGNHGMADISWSDDSSYYRVMQTSDFEQQIGEQLGELGVGADASGEMEWSDDSYDE